MAWSKAYLVALALLAGCFSPTHDRCAVSCQGDRRCPSGMSCLSDGFCHARPTDSLCTLASDGGIVDAGGGDAAGARCGDGVIQPELDEECDDGDTDDGDGCSATCREEVGFVCVEEPSVCRPNPSEHGHFVITELMIDPDKVSDLDGEWIEIFNPTDIDFDLRGMVGTDDGNESFVVTESIVLEAGAHIVIGNNTDPAENGGAPVVFDWGGGYRLGNNTDAVNLSFGGVLIDRVTYAIVNRGVSRSLSADAYNADANDIGLNYCDGATPYGDGDLGTPGEMNPDC